MSLNEIQSRSSVLAAISEYDRLGKAAFLEKYGFGEARSYFIFHEGNCHRRMHIRDDAKDRKTLMLRIRERNGN